MHDFAGGAGGTKPQIKFKMATLASLAQKTTDVSQAGGDADISDENAPSTEGLLQVAKKPVF